MQKIKNVSVGCIVLMSIGGHSAVQGMKREREISPVLVQAAEEMLSYENNMDFIKDFLNKQKLREEILKSIKHGDEQDALVKPISAEKPEIEPKASFFCDKCTFVSFYSYSLQRHTRNIHPKK